MNPNGERRLAQRQKRGVQRVEDILDAAGILFTEHGYDQVTMNMISNKAAITPGSLYQFFPNKDAVTEAYAEMVTHQLHHLYDAMMAPDVLELPFTLMLDRFIDGLMVFNRTYPGYLALELGATQSAPLRKVLTTLQQGLQDRLDALIATYWPQSTRERRQNPLLISYRLFLVILPLTRQGDEARGGAIVQEMKTMLQQYWASLITSDDIVSE